MEVDGLNAGFAQALLDEYLENPDSVPDEWRDLFESSADEVLATQPGLARLLEERGLRPATLALDEALRIVTADVGGTARCSEFGARVRDNLRVELGKLDAHLALISMNRGCCA